MVPGLDGRKMSKSYNNTIEIFDDPATIRKKVKKIVTDSTPGRGSQEPRHLPAVQPVQALRRARRARRGRAALSRGGDRLRRGEDPAGRGHDRPVRPARERRADWLAHPERVAEVRAAAAARAKATRPRRPRPRPCRVRGRLIEDPTGRRSSNRDSSIISDRGGDRIRHKTVYEDRCARSIMIALPGDRLECAGRPRLVPGRSAGSSSPPAESARPNDVCRQSRI